MSLSTKPRGWLQIEMSREQAERALTNTSAGTFVIRNSSQNGYLALTIRMPPSATKTVKSLLINSKKTPRGTSYALQKSSRNFESLDKLVAYYSNNFDDSKQLGVKLKSEFALIDKKIDSSHIGARVIVKSIGDPEEEDFEGFGDYKGDRVDNFGFSHPTEKDAHPAQSAFIPEWAVENENAFNVYEGRRPSSYRVVLNSLTQLLLEYAKSDDDRAKVIKPVVFRIGAHLNDIVKAGENIGNSVDISAEEAHTMLQEAATKASTIVTEGQHAALVAMGAARKLKLPKVPEKSPLQDAFVPFLHKSFNKRVDKLLQDETHSMVDKAELRAVALLVQGAYIDELLKKEEIGSYISGFKEAPNKNFLRTMVKIDGDYADEKNSHAHLLDVVRRSAETETLDEQEMFCSKLVEVKDGKIKKFQIIRSKDEAMTDEKADVKFVIVNMAYTPTKYGRVITFGDMVNDPSFDAVVDRITKSSEYIDTKTMDCVVELLRDPELKKKVCKMVVEFQLYLTRFLKIKKRLHGIYKFQRAENLLDLTRDLAPHASSQSMAYVTNANTYNIVFAARASRMLRKLGLSWGMLSFSVKKHPTVDIESLMRQVAAAGVHGFELESTDEPTILGWNHEAGKAIGIALETNSTLKKLILSSNKLGDEAGKAIGKALETNSTLRDLDLYGNQLGDEAGKAIGKGLETNSSLNELRLQNNQLGDEAGKAIGKGLETNSTLEELNMWENQLGDEAGKAIGKALATNSALRDLDLNGNQLGDEAGKAIGKALETNSTMHRLDLRKNKLGDEAGKAIGKGLETNSTLWNVNLRRNKLGDEAGKAIGKALETNSTLCRLELDLDFEAGRDVEIRAEFNGRTLCVQGRLERASTFLTEVVPAIVKSGAIELYIHGKAQLGDEAGKAIGMALETNTTLKKLILWRTMLGDEAGKAIGKALATNSTLMILDLSSNELGDEAAKAIGKALETNSTLRELNLDFNMLSKNTKKSIKNRAGSGLKVRC